MADYSFGGTDEENAELKKLNAEVVRTSERLATVRRLCNDPLTCYPERRT